MPQEIEPETEDLTAFVVEDEATTPEETAARAIYAALVADTGRPKGMGHWKPVVKEALGVKALWARRWQAVLELGKTLGLFEVDDSRKYPVLVPLEQVEPEPEPEPTPERGSYISNIDASIPDDWEPPGMLPCGHPETQYKKLEPDPEDHRRGKTYETVLVTDVADCLMCAAGVPGHPQYTEEEYKKPLPENMRRTRYKVMMGGFPGYCVDDEGYYIGGVGNDCRYYRPKGTDMCAHHKAETAARLPKKKRKKK